MFTRRIHDASTSLRIDPVLAFGLALAVAIPSSLAAQESEVRVDVRGVRNALRDNVLATVSVGRLAERTRLSEPGVRALLDRAPREVRSALEPFGYYEASVRDSLRYDGRRWQVVLDVSPGSPVILSRADVRITGPGSDDPIFAEALRRAPLTTGSPVSHAAYEATKSNLATAAAERGYLEATFDSAVVRIDREARSATAVLRFATGPRYRLGAVTFLQDVLDPALLAELVPWDPGAPYDGAQLLALRAALTEGPYFSGVEVTPLRDRAVDRVVPIEVTLVPSRPQRYSVGAGYGSDTGPRATMTAEIRRINRGGHRAELDARVAAVELRASARYYIPLRTRRMGLLSFSAGYVDAHPETSDTETWILGTNVAGLWGGWRSDVGITLQRANYEVGAQEGITTLFLLGTGISRVRADDRLDPSRGSLVRLRMRGGHNALVGDVWLFDIGVEAKAIRSLHPRLRVLGRMEVAALETSNFSRLPGSIRYFTGGDRSVRGFAYQELGPVDGDGNVIGGSRLLVGSLEVEAALTPRWGFAAFVDAGNALTTFSDPLETGVGMGLRWRSPIGVIRLDGAFAVSRSGAPFRFHVNVGPEL